MALSTAVPAGTLSRVLGYKIIKGDFATTTPNLPQRIAILGEANTANQGALSTDGTEVTTLQQAGELYGYGSPIYHAMRILRPISGSGVSVVPTIVYAQEEPAAATAKAIEITPVGTATKNGTHQLRIAGRTSVDGEVYNINIVKGDDAAAVTAKIEDAVNNVLGSPFSATSTDYEATLTSKWKGLTAEELSVVVETGDVSLGITYGYNQTSTGSGTPSVSDALQEFGNQWNTIVLNGYSTQTDVMDALEDFNGIADPNNPTGRYSPTIFKPFIAITGSTADNPSAITDSRKDDMTIAIAPAPLSKGLTIEAAANYTLLFAPTAQTSPHSGISGRSIIDMPTPTSIGTMATFTNRDSYVKKGCSTVDLVSGRYQVQDFVTTYHPVGEIPAQYARCRGLIQDFNVKFGEQLIIVGDVIDNTLTNDDAFVDVNGVIKPKQVKALLRAYADDLERRGIIADAPFMQDSINVAIDGSNPNRLNIQYKYKRTGTAIVVSTDAIAGFNFG